MNVLLFSGGQDSAFLLLIFFFQKTKKTLSLITLNHGAQLNAFAILSHSFSNGIYFQQNNILLNLSNNFLNAESSEELLRADRYENVFRIKQFYFLTCFCTGHTESDLIETYFFQFFRTLTFKQKQLTYRSKILSSENFHKFQYKKPKPSICKHAKYVKKPKVDYTLSTLQKQKTRFTRPFQSISRNAIFEISKFFPFFLSPDLSNLSLVFSRNRVRRHLVPYATKFFLVKRFEFRNRRKSKTIGSSIFLFTTNFQNYQLVENQSFLIDNSKNFVYLKYFFSYKVNKKYKMLTQSIYFFTTKFYIFIF
jgi:tRNA(Ile)-lysidine synthase TilS/MesJ